MKKTIITLSAVAALTTASFGATDVETRLSNMEKKIKKLEKKLKKSNKKLNQVKAHDAGDNIKWDVDFRTAVDKINYKHATGPDSSNDALFTNRLLLNMKYKADDTVTFYGTLSNNKSYGDSANHSQSNTNPGYANFDWVTNENATDDSIKVKEAYWLYANDTFFGKDMPWTASIGRRPSTGGLGINYREGDKRKSAIASTVNIEFDGASFRWNTDKVGGPTGSWFKICVGRGITNATPRFSNTNNGANYTNDTSKHGDSDMIGLIVVPYDDGQYSLHTNYAKAGNMIGFTSTQIGYMQDNNTSTVASFQDVGSLSIMTAMIKVEGIGEEINDFLDETTIFASYSRSVTDPTASAAEGGMLGSADSETGTSYWVGAILPVDEKSYIGLEFNHGSEFWRPFTYSEDTMIGSKLATRGDAFEAYFNYQLTDSLSAQIRYTDITYDYTGSNGFFGNFAGASNKISDIKDGAKAFAQLGGTLDSNGANNLGVVTGNLIASGMAPGQAQQTAGALAGAALFAPNVVEAAQDFRFYLRYRF